MNEIPANQAEPSESLCPTCGKFVETHKCRLCGAVRTVNAVSGNIIWIRNGRVIRAFKDSKEAFVRAAKEWNIPLDQWPDDFRK